MTNFDHTIEDGAEETLRSGKFYGSHAAWDFHGTVWWDGSQFAERVRVYRVTRGTYRATTLRELMTKVSDIYGWD
jgi:hypothetical protein